jgi:propionyl-CoA synthetase
LNKSGEDIEHFQLQHEVVHLVREQIGAVAALRDVVIVNRLPKTRSGKILRKICEVLPMVKISSSFNH